MDLETFYEACNYLLTEMKDTTLNIKKGHLFKQMLSAGELIDGWYTINTETGEILGGPYPRAYTAYDKAADSGVDPKKLDVVCLKNSKYIKASDFKGQTFTKNFPAGWYIVDKNSKLVVKGPINNSQARLYAKGDQTPLEANGKV